MREDKTMRKDEERRPEYRKKSRKNGKSQLSKMIRRCKKAFRRLDTTQKLFLGCIGFIVVMSVVLVCGIIRSELAMKQVAVSADAVVTDDQDAQGNQKQGEALSDQDEADSQDASIQKKDTDKARASAENADAQNQTAEPQGEYPGQKKVYLTFDDGPSQYTGQILDILEQYQVKATFFEICNTRERDKQSMKRIVDTGNTIAIHSVSHEYSKIYASLDSFHEDVIGMQDYLQETTGIKTSFYRFPGGSNNHTSCVSLDECKQLLKDNEITYFDWNVDSGDASMNHMPKDKIVANVLSEVGCKEESVVLMHDTNAKDTTVQALPEIIQSLKDQGYLILPITENTKPVHFGE